MGDEVFQEMVVIMGGSSIKGGVYLFVLYVAASLEPLAPYSSPLSTNLAKWSNTLKQV